MTQRRQVPIGRLVTGIPGLDTVLGGGLPEYSFNLIAGGPGAGKTTLAHQIMFANASQARPVVYFTVLGEPSLKMLRYQQQYRFFDPTRVDGQIRFINLSQVVLENDLSHVLERIVREVEQADPGIVVVDSFRTVVRAATTAATGEMELQGFVQRLALFLTSWQATTFLVGEYVDSEMRDNPVFTVADGILWLYQSVERNSIVRKIQVVKMRGIAPMPGLHTFRITDDGLQVFPRMLQRTQVADRPKERDRITSGVEGFDEMLGGGIRQGDSVLIAGPSGTGKTVLSMQFIAEGVRQSEPGVIAVFEEHPQEYVQRAAALGFDLQGMIDQGQLEVIYLRPLDLSVDETMREIRDAADRIGAKRVVIDSLSGFELALAPTFRDDFRESLYRMVGALTGHGITIMMSVEVRENFTEISFSPHAVSFLSDEIILLRYVEIESQLRRVIAVVKMRSSDHSHDLREYQITANGLIVGETLPQYHAILTGIPTRRDPAARGLHPGLTDPELVVLRELTGLSEATAEEIAERTGLRRPIVNGALERLVALTYVIRVGDGGRRVYRPVAQPLGG